MIWWCLQGCFLNGDTIIQTIEQTQETVFKNVILWKCRFLSKPKCSLSLIKAVQPEIVCNIQDGVYNKKREQEQEQKHWLLCKISPL